MGAAGLNRDDRAQDRDGSSPDGGKAEVSASGSRAKPPRPLEGLVHEVVSAVASPDVSSLVLASALSRAGLRELPESPEVLATFVRDHLRPAADDMVGDGTGVLISDSVGEVLRRASSLPPPAPRPLPEPPKGAFGDSPPSHVRPKLTEDEAARTVRQAGKAAAPPSPEPAAAASGEPAPGPTASEPAPRPAHVAPTTASVLSSLPRRAVPPPPSEGADDDPFAALDPPPKDRHHESATGPGELAFDPSDALALDPPDDDDDDEPASAGGLPQAPTTGADLAMAARDLAAFGPAPHDPRGAAVYALTTWSRVAPLRSRTRLLAKEVVRARGRVRTLVQHLARRLAARSAQRGGLGGVNREVHRVLEAARDLAGRTDGRTGFGLLLLAGEAAVRTPEEVAGTRTPQARLAAVAARIDALRGLARNLTRLGAKAMRRGWLDVGQSCTSTAVALRRTADLEEDLAQYRHAPLTADRRALLVGWATIGGALVALLGAVAGVIAIVAG